MHTISSNKFYRTKAHALTPLGTQTRSKSRLWPNFPILIRSEGYRIWDIENKIYIDLSGSLGPNILGYNHNHVTNAIRAQLTKGITFPFTTDIELELLDLLTTVYPGAEQVRLLKSGSEALSAAVRLARAYTNRTKILCCTYHGWHDWYIGTTKHSAGVPLEIQALTHKTEFELLSDYLLKEEYAAVIVEPYAEMPPDAYQAYLQEIQGACIETGALLIFDEVISGFRLAPGGGAELYGVTPDLACLGKSMANGMPLSALVGHRDLMNMLTQDVFISSTWGGETLSIAAAIATITYILEHNVSRHLTDLTTSIFSGHCSITPKAILLQEIEATPNRLLDHSIIYSGRPLLSYAHVIDQSWIKILNDLP